MQISIEDLAAQLAKSMNKPKDADLEWDEYTPIKISDDNKTIDVYLNDAVHLPCNYSRLCYTLLTKPTEEWTTNIHINNGGGLETSATMVMNAISKSKSKVVAHLSGLVASAATMITMACDDIKVSDHLMFMIHEASFEDAGGKFSDMRTFQAFYERYSKEQSQQVYGGFLTAEEIAEMHNGKEQWFTSTEVVDRWEKMKCIK